LIELTGQEGTIYKGEKFILKFVFPQNYPFENPIVTFVPPNIPKHKVWK